MTISSDDYQPAKILIASEAYIEAEKAYKQQTLSQSKQIYLNVLAIHVVKQYLQWLAIPADWSNCDSNDPSLRQFLDVADLEIKGLGRLECRPVLPDALTLDIPSEAHSDRIGYIAVQFDEELETATLLGFVRTASSKPIPITDLEPLELLLDTLEATPMVWSPVANIPEELLNWQEPVPLGEWFSHTSHEIVSMGWQTLESIEKFLAPETRMKLVSNVRSRAVVAPERGKLKSLGLEKGNEQVALVIGLHEITPPETEISVKVYPTGKQTYLPRDLELIVLDEAGTAVMQAQARSNKSIQMEFSGETGEGFSIKLALGDFSVIEAFQL